MPCNKENQEISVLGRLFSLEILVVIMGAACLIFGIFTARPAQIIMGALILVVTLLLAYRWRRVRLK